MARASKVAEAKNSSPVSTLHIEVWPLDKLIPYARNARTRSDERVTQTAASIKEFGFKSRKAGPVPICSGAK